MIPLKVQIACVQREIAMRVRVYASRVRDGKMKQSQADAELEAMRAVLKTVERFESALSILESVPCPNHCSDGMIVNTGPDPVFEPCQFCDSRDALFGRGQYDAKARHERFGCFNDLPGAVMCQVCGADLLNPGEATKRHSERTNGDA